MPRLPLSRRVRVRSMAAILVTALAAAGGLTACGPPPPLAARPSGAAFAVEPLFHDGAAWAPPPVEAALRLSSAEPRFGGWSGLTVDGATLTMVSDRGYYLRLTLDPAAPGGLGPGEPRFGVLPDAAGRPLDGTARDAEDIVVLPDGAMVVSFERDHRLWLYPATAAKPFSAPPRPLPAPPGLADAPFNGGVEALTRLPDGRLLAVVEGDGGDGAATTPGWLGTPSGPDLDRIDWQPLRLAVDDGFRPTAAAVAANGDLLVLERAFSIPAGFSNRIRRIPATAAAAAIAAGTALTGPVVFRLDRPPVNDNFEGMAAIPLPDGTTRVLLVSDDNYSGLQRTLLVALRL